MSVRRLPRLFAYPASRGFTLIEVMVALAIFAVMATIAYAGLNAMARTRADLAEVDDRLREVGFGLHLMERDLRQAVARAVRDSYGGELPELIGEPSRIEFTRAGVRHAPGVLLPSLQRVAWGVDSRRLMQTRWLQLDRAPSTQAQSREAITELDGLRLSYLDAAGVWQDRWPAPAGDDRSALPRAVEIVLQFDDIGELRRLVVLPSSEGSP